MTVTVYKYNKETKEKTISNFYDIQYISVKDNVLVIYNDNDLARHFRLNDRLYFRDFEINE